MRGRFVVAAGVMSAACSMVLAIPSGAAPADGNGKAVVEVSTDELVPGLGDVLEAACSELGLDVGQVEVYVTGWSRSMGPSRTVFHFVATAVSSRGTSSSGMDVGPDRVYQRDGKQYVSVTGRSITGTGVVGRVVLDLGTNPPTVVATSGNISWVARPCAELAGTPA